MKSFPIVIVPLGVTAAFIVAGLLTNDYWRYVFSLVAASVVTGMGLTMLVGFARCVTLATGAIQAIGAYTAALLLIHLAMPFPLAILIAGLMGGLGALLLAIPAVRFRSHNLAMVTLVFQSVIIILLREIRGLTGGAEGLTVPLPSILGSPIQSDLAYLTMTSIFCGLMLIPLIILLRGPFGRNLQALATNEVAARAFGIRIEHHLIAAFVISSVAIAMAAAVVAPRFRIIDPESYGLHTSILALAYPIVGGLSSTWGGAIGGGVLRTLPELLRPIAGLIELILSVIVIATLLFFRGGLSEGLSHLGGILRIARRGEPARTAAETRSATPTSPTISPGSPRGPGSNVALTIRGVVKRYDALTAVDTVDLEVAEGSLHGIMGPNGAGKTTLFNMVSGFISPDAGSINLFGSDVTRRRVEERVNLGITRTFQHVAIFPALTCYQNVIAGAGLNSIGQSIARSFSWAADTAAARKEAEDAHWALAAVGLSEMADLRAGQLSLGDQRRLEIARAIISRPRAILLDEPVSGVSEQEAQRLLVLLKRLNRELNVTMLVVEHDIGFLVSLCDRLSMMASGRIIAEGVPNEVIARPDVRRIYFGETAEVVG